MTRYDAKALAYGTRLPFPVPSDPRLWANGTVETRADGGVISFCIDMSPDRSALAIGACMKYLDGTAHIELAEYRDTKKHGTAWATDWIEQRWPKTAAVVIDAQSPAMVRCCPN